jgi:CRISPR-associated protein Cpf1
LYATVIDPQGNILLQKSFNTIVNIDYATKLQHREKARDDARKNWNAIEGIKDLKEGYLSQVIHEISRMMIKYNAVIALEDLNSGFKRGRYKIERQVYQKFEKMLINKLNYLFFKDEDPLKPGGLFKGYQLTDKFTSFKELGKQCGFLFYVPAAYTSKIDPVTGFANVFDLRDLTNVQKKKEFFNQFDSIRYMPDMNLFCFSFDYKNFKVHQTCYKTKWTVFSNGKRIIWDPKLKTYKDIHPTEELSKLFDKYGISYQSGEELKNAIAEIDAVKANAPFFDALYSTFSRLLQLRHTNSEEDYIISPVMSDSGIFFNSNEVEDGKLPVDADANGAYHIALKGLYLLRNIVAYADSSGQIKSNAIVIKNEDWFRFVQNQEYRNSSVDLLSPIPTIRNR